MGGLEAYQRMSAIGQGEDRGGGTEKVLIEWLKELGLGNLGTSRSEKGKSKAKLEWVLRFKLRPHRQF
jgi:25S rRNA (adenine2142-N1)-methyltransferase